MKCDICGLEADSVSYAMWTGVGACRTPACREEAKRRRDILEAEIFAEPFDFQDTKDATDIKRMFARFGRLMLDAAIREGVMEKSDRHPMATSPFWWGEIAEERVIPRVPEQYLSVPTEKTILSGGSFEVVQPIPAAVWEKAFRGSGMLAE